MLSQISFSFRFLGGINFLPVLLGYWQTFYYYYYWNRRCTALGSTPNLCSPSRIGRTPKVARKMILSMHFCAYAMNQLTKKEKMLKKTLQLYLNLSDRENFRVFRKRPLAVSRLLTTECLKIPYFSRTFHFLFFFRTSFFFIIGFKNFRRCRKQSFFFHGSYIWFHKHRETLALMKCSSAATSNLSTRKSVNQPRKSGSTVSGNLLSCVKNAHLISDAGVWQTAISAGFRFPPKPRKTWVSLQ